MQRIKLFSIFVFTFLFSQIFQGQNPSLIMPIGHNGRITAIDISPNGKYAATGGDDQVVILWNLESGKIIKRFTGIPNGILSLEIDPEFKYIAVGTKSNVSRVGNTGTSAVMLDIVSGKIIHVFDDLPYEVKDITFSSDGGKLALGSTIWLYQYEIPSMKLINKFKAGKDGLLSLIIYVNEIEYIEGGKKIITNYSKGVAIWDANTGKRLRKMDYHKYDANGVVLSNDERYMVTTCMDKTLAIWDMTSQSVISNLNGGLWYFGQVYISPDNKYLVYNLYNNTSMIEAFDLTTGNKVLSIEGKRGEFSGVSLINNNTELVTIGAIDFKESTFQKYRFPSGEKIGEYAPPANTLGEEWTTISSFDTEKALVAGSVKGMLVKWDLEMMTPVFNEKNKDKIMISDIAIDHKRNSFFVGRNDGLIAKYSSEGKEIGFFGKENVKPVNRMLTHDERFAGSSSSGVSDAAPTGISCLAIENDYSALLSGTYTGELRYYDLKTDKSSLLKAGNNTARNLRHNFYKEYEGGPIKGVAFGNSENDYGYSVFDITEYFSLGQLDMPLDDEKQSNFNYKGNLVPIKKISGKIKYSPDGDFGFITQYNGLYKYNLSTGKEIQVIKVFDDAILDFEFSNDGTKIVLVGRSQEIALYDTKNQTLLYKVSAHGSNITGVDFTFDDEFILTSSLDNSCGIWKTSNGEKVLSLYFFMDEEWMAVTPEGYYFATKNATKKLNYVIGLDVHSFEQFDLKYNRPDLVLKQTGYTEERLINAYYKAYKKRLLKMGFTEEMLENDFEIPKLEIKNFEELPLNIDESSLELNLKIIDDNHPIDRINVWVNDVAIFGSNGINVRSENAKYLEKTIKIPLVYGDNKIQVSVLNQSGAESYKKLHNIFCSRGKTKPDLYLITIGDSKYKQNKYNLNYAAKDAQDLSSLFKNSKVYENIFSKTLTNEKVTKNNILGLQTFFEKADINDQVIIFFAGHGVLSSDLEYYLATYDMDFNSPEKKGLAYEDLERLLDGIKPLKKILIIDACHSGEIDKDDVLLTQNELPEEGDVQFRVVGNSLKSKLGEQNTLELTKSLFTDLRKGTGATIISSAGGMEFAMESSDWKNGLFTFVLINGIKSGEADLNNDGEIWLSELQKYVGEKVTTLSQGKQQPTSRIENQTIDIKVWQN